MGERPLDEIDSKILRILMQDSRASISQIAKALGLSRPTVRRRIRSLEKRGVIKAYTIEIDEKLLLGALVVCTIQSSQPEETLMKLRKISGIYEVFITTGKPNIVAVARVSSYEELEELARNLSAIDPEADVKIAIKHVYRSLSYEMLARFGVVSLFCDYCGKKISGEPLTYTVHNRKYYFCCPTCLREYVKKLKKR